MNTTGGPGEPSRPLDGGAPTARALDPVADDPPDVTLQEGFVGSNAEWHELQVVTHAIDDPTRARQLTHSRASWSVLPHMLSTGQGDAWLWTSSANVAA